MRILAVYPELTLPLIRRVRAPFSVLSERGSTFHFLQAPTFSGGLSQAYDVTVLSDWVLSDADFQSFREARASGRSLVCDLSEGSLLSSPRMQEQLRETSLVTVPTERLKKEVQNLVGVTRVAVLPSCVDVAYFASANRLPRPEATCIGCFGPGEWGPIRDGIIAFQAACPSVRLLGDEAACLAINGPHAARGPVMAVLPHPESYPAILHGCRAGLLVSSGDGSLDPIWEHEYGILCRPVLHVNVSHKVDPESFVRRLMPLVQEDAHRAALGQAAFERANEQRASRLADHYARLYRRHFSHVA